MKLLKDILYQTRIVDLFGNTNVAVDQIAFDSRKVVSFSLFVAVKGTQVDGHKFIDQAILSGAIAIVCEEFPENLKSGITYVKVMDASLALGFIASNFYDNPSSKIKLVGITGTNGKTTTATLLYNLYRSLGFKVGLLSTVENKINSETIAATHTTPDAISLNLLLSEMNQKGCSHCFMEVSSHAIDQKRVAGIQFEGAVFTNITHDHLDYHKTFNEYIKAKKGLFDSLTKEAFALVNIDDRQGETMLQNCKAKKNTYAIKTIADFKAKILENNFTGLHISIDNQDLYAKLIGSFNVYNILAVYGTSILLGQSQMDVLTAISNLNSVAGRFQYIKTESNIIAIVDYAHTPDALQNVLTTINDIRTRNEKVITVVGCGGNRDAAKRPEMARISCQLSDKVVLTSDNPRNENPSDIIEQMKKGVESLHYKKTVAVEDRREAIKLACSLADPGDIVLIAGKGHEKYQEIKGEKFPFDDFLIVNETFKMLHK
jgi:UDP-N-acetylmuramoyl-L-alanyl-D-glutamate--2,6-diaminopimelate ligase